MRRNSPLGYLSGLLFYTEAVERETMLRLLMAVLGFLLGAAVGALASFYMAFIYVVWIEPLFHNRNYDDPGGIVRLLIVTPIGAIIGGILVTRLLLAKR